jgi:hypothetical protein
MQGLSERRSARPRPRLAEAASSSVCVCADDYGATPGTNAAIESLVERGKVDAVSVMAHRASTLGTARVLRESGVPIGLHLCFTGHAGFPRNYGGLVARLVSSPRSTLRAIEIEAEKQVDRLLASGLTIAFLNGHEHVHLLPMVWPIVARIARRLRVRAIRTAIGQPIDLSTAGLLAASSRLSWLLAPLEGMTALSPLGVGRAGTFGLEAIERSLSRPFGGATATRELCMHPSFDDEGRRAEYELIASGRLGELFAQRGFTQRAP